MKVICPKCQFENQADSVRVVCARCATIIEVRPDQGTSPGNGRVPAGRLPFAANPGTGQPMSGPPSESQPQNQSPQDVYATRIGDDFDDVLDIPRPTPSSYQTNYEQTPVFDDIFGSTGYDSSTSYDFGAEEKTPSRPVSTGFPSGIGQQRRETADYAAAPEQEFMGWPVLPEHSADEEEPVNGFASSRGGLLARMVLGAIVFGGLIFGAYYFLGDLISKRKDQNSNIIAGGAPATSQASPPGADANPAVGDQTSAKSEAPKTETTPPVVNPKPEPAKQQAAVDTGTKKGGERVDIPPIQGRSGPSDAPRKVTAPTLAAAPTGGNFTIQVASYNDQSQANSQAARLKSAGGDPRVVRAEIPGRGTWYRVQLGGFGTREQAMSYANQMKSRGVIREFIVTTIGK